MGYRLRFVEPLVIIYLFGQTLSGPPSSVYIYNRILHEIGNGSHGTAAGSSGGGAANGSQENCAGLNASDVSSKQAQEQTSQFYLYLSLSGFVPIMVAGLALGALSDNHGRRLALMLPLFGDILSTVIFILLVYFELPLWVLYVSNVLTGFLGGTTTLLGISFAYVADTTTKMNRNWRVALLEMALGAVGIGASFASGHFMRVAEGIKGLLAPFYFEVGVDVVCLFYAAFFLHETVGAGGGPPLLADPQHAPGDRHQQGQQQGQQGQQRQQQQGRPKTVGDYARETVQGFVLLVRAGGDPARRRRLLLLLGTFATVALAFFGGSGLLTLYQQGPPLCWGAVMVGYGQALFCCVYVTSFLGVTLASRFRVPDGAIALVGMASFAGGMVTTAFARTSLAMFLANIPLMFTVMPAPVIRSMLSKAVQPSEQGAVFAAVACVEMVSALVSTLIFNSVYTATVAWFPGFSFLLAAAFMLIPMALVGVVRCTRDPEPHYTRVPTDNGDASHTYGSIQ
ncbi:lysosomal proton-coupled steroid conjugate and bile acid symporter SLC46A3-like isoform X2 [Petromyzon marinus]|uniref:lysosomal proton-coupled steroid conjugate and bile acid symporter SLC46A3-like isoform X2 n=1 Tax=Petromyzon marinus TaxID=7757 RepID=UPI003F7024F7